MNSTESLSGVSPDVLMEKFQGRGVKPIIVFTIVVHAVVLLGTSIPFLWRTAFGANTADMTEEQRIDGAVREATASLRDIAAEYGLSPQDISRQFAGGSRPAATSAEPETAPAETAPERAKSEIEKELETTASGPALPEVKDDIF